MTEPVPADVPRERQTLTLPESKLRSLREWAVEGTGLAVGARVRDPAGRTALVRNQWSEGWILPGGGVEPEEDPVAAVRREVREETGLDATVCAPLVVLDQSYVSATEGRERFAAQYVAYAAAAEGAIPDATELGETDDEIRAARWFESPPADLHDGDLLRPYL